MEPNAYFEDIKNNIQQLNDEELIKAFNRYLQVIEDAIALGQEDLVELSRFQAKTIQKELTAYKEGIRRYVYTDDIIKFIDKVKPARSVRIIDLKNYRRVIPEENRNVIKEVKSKNIFDKFCVIYTDYTETTNPSPKEQKIIKENRDPICFGYFENTTSQEKGSRFYFITDWIDEYCDLTLDKMIELADEKHLGKIVYENTVADKIIDYHLLPSTTVKESVFNRWFKKLKGRRYKK